MIIRTDTFLNKGDLRMKYSTPARYQAIITLFLLVLFVTGCASKIPEFPPYQLVSKNLLEQKKKKVFKIGVVKADGNPYTAVSGTIRFEYKKKALDRIPLEEISALLSSKYSISIDTTVDKTARVVKEGCGHHAGQLRVSTGGNPQFFAAMRINAWWVDSVYYGNLRYDAENVCSEAFNHDDFPDVVNVMYSFYYESKVVFYYDIAVNSSGQDVIKIHGVVESEPTEKADSFEERCNSYAEYASNIGKAVKRDLFEAASTGIQQ